MGIIVVADDFSGAVELAGVAVRYGLYSTICLSKLPTAAHTDVTCADLNTRSMSAEEARRTTADAFAQLLARETQDHRSRQMGLDWGVSIFKKTDSLLRGHIAEEVLATLSATGLNRCILCPANPRRGRVICDQEYWVHDRKLADTFFAHDPQFPRWTSNVRELLAGSFTNDLERSSAPQPSLSEIHTPDIRCFDDLMDIVRRLDPQTFLAGGSDFFEAFLMHLGHRMNASTAPQINGKRVFVCGSLAAWTSGRKQDVQVHGIETLTLETGGDLALQAAETLKDSDQLMLAVGAPEVLDDRITDWSAKLAEQAVELVRRVPISWIFLEGGETARNVIDRSGLDEFECIGELSPGVVAIRSQSINFPNMVVKPGSYPWPSLVWG